ncbi:CNX1E [Auxenochlorella protothecoides x Auxenochlorella symbiontica]
MEPVRTPAANYSMVSVAEAVETVLGATRPLPPQEFSYIDALGLTLAEDVLARDPIPAYRASIKDGYAVRAVDGPGIYPVAFEAFAGAEPETLPPGTVAYIGTGGPLPEGADAVVQIEDTLDQGADDRGQRLVKILMEVPGPGYDVRQIGSDVAQGEVILPAGHHLLPAEIGILAGSGAVTVKAYPRPRVAVLSTGDEVKDPAAVALGPGQVRDANRAMLMAAVSEAGALAQDLGIAGDTEEESTAAFRRALDGGADVMLITGGVSMGQRDYIKPLLEAQGTVHFGKVCMKPGKPLTFAEVPREGRAPLLVFGLPGNPVSGLVTFNLVVLPCLKRLQGWGDPGLRRVHARLSFDIKQDPARPEYHRAIGSWRRMAGGDKWELVAQSTGGQISSRLLSLRAANLLLEIPRRKGVLVAGTQVSALIIGDLGCMPVHESVDTTPGF